MYIPTHWCYMYKQCHSVVMRLFGPSLQVCGALFPHVWQDGDLFLHCCLLRPLVNKLACYMFICMCMYSICSYVFLLYALPGWTCGSWVPGGVTCAGWFGSWLRLEPPMSSSSMRGQFIHSFICFYPCWTSDKIISSQRSTYQLFLSSQLHPMIFFSDFPKFKIFKSLCVEMVKRCVM